MSSTPSAPAPSAAMRLDQVDALRGLAALAVVLFHYTTQHQKLFAPASSASFAVPWGHLGVNLFFIISGFVIFMTLDRCRQPMDFVVSRFSRLFPSYWLAIALTFTVVSIFGLPGKEVSAWQAAANLLMLHGFAHIPHVDGVYWTLEVEMLFYIAMFTLYRVGCLSAVHRAIAALLSIKLIYLACAQFLGVDLPWILHRTLFLSTAPWFALGICVRQLTQLSADPQASTSALRRRIIGSVLLALVTIGWGEGWSMTLLAAALATVVYAAAMGRLPPLRLKLLGWLGAISYPLYLLHENIGWVLMNQLQARGLSTDLSIAVALVFSLTLAHLVTQIVERPAMAAIRRIWAQRQGLQRKPLHSA
ncbi:acyltransferase family protein [Paucibacter sp. DJ2R-2]|uniref:acyltransferase family protein n=1 Tax=Paucibacter sp. DJ2R-2 TaxID=2893558 RepID=UPI0021E4D13C|nr:acyltransferase [Paucibacter sp. DJ2R-2]MCV2420635.1 acyltransferase [Paucibacter sp. DJ4R-1]MCV2439813.1 acyltransferase [Paucibacter sp. DJ2R-2]